MRINSMPSGAPSAGGHLVPAGSAPGNFRVYGLRVRSAIDLPGFPIAAATDPDLIILRERLTGPLADDRRYATHAVGTEGEFRLAVSGVGRFAAIGGSLIRVDADSDAKAADILLFLTGAMMGAILHQRGAFPLHASCVALPRGEGGAAFAGASGAGKSTLVGALIHKGAQFVSDDICVMAPAPDGKLRVWPGAGRLKLDETGLAVLANSGADLASAGGGRGKFHLPVEQSLHQTSPAPLHRVYILTDGAGPPRIERLTGIEAISALVDQTYLLAAARDMGLTARVFRLAAAVAQAVTVSRLIRPRGLEHLPEMVALIAEDARDPEAWLHQA